MINHKRKYIFIHIPKTAGVSIYSLLNHKGQQDHKTIMDYEEDYFSFAIVRNPWDRLVSAYFYLKKGGRGYKGDLFAKSVLDPYKNFKDFVLDLENVSAQMEEFSNPSNGNEITGFPHFLPQVRWTHDSERGSQRVNYIAYFENLKPSLEKIRPLLGLRRIKLENRNRSSRSDYREYYDQESCRFVYDYYAKDISAFGYEFDKRGC